MRNLHAARTPHAALPVLAASYPPSAKAFDAVALPVLRPMLRFLAEADTGAWSIPTRS